MLDMRTFLLEQAAWCRRLAQTISDEDFAEKLLIMAHGYEVKASNVQSPPTVPSGVPDMTNPPRRKSSAAHTSCGNAQASQKGRIKNFILKQSGN
jgi:hypothetical protein